MERLCLPVCFHGRKQSFQERIFFGNESKQEVIKVVAILLKGILRHACPN